MEWLTINLVYMFFEVSQTQLLDSQFSSQLNGEKQATHEKASLFDTDVEHGKQCYLLGEPGGVIHTKASISIWGGGCGNEFI